MKINWKCKKFNEFYFNHIDHNIFNNYEYLCLIKIIIYLCYLFIYYYIIIYLLLY